MSDFDFDLVNYINWYQREAILDRLHREIGGTVESTDQPDNANSPTLYATLLERSINTHREIVKKAVKEDTAWLERQINEEVDTALQRVYAEGVRHGFQQGVEAECKRRGD